MIRIRNTIFFTHSMWNKVQTSLFDFEIVKAVQLEPCLHIGRTNHGAHIGEGNQSALRTNELLTLEHTGEFLYII